MLSLSAAAITTSCCCVFLTLVCVTEANPPFWLWQKPNFTQFWNIEDQGNYACGHFLSHNIPFLLVHLYIIFLLPLFLPLPFHTLFTSLFLFPCHRRQKHSYPFSSFFLSLSFFFFNTLRIMSCVFLLHPRIQNIWGQMWHRLDCSARNVTKIFCTLLPFAVLVHSWHDRPKTRCWEAECLR